MSTALFHPGVYVREISSGARSVEGIPTSTTIFVGECERGPLNATPITSRLEFERLFGGYFRWKSQSGTSDSDAERVLLPYSLDGYFSNGGTLAYILRLVPPGSMTTASVHNAGTAFLNASSPGIWGNRLSVIVGAATSPSLPDQFRLQVFYQAPGPALPGAADAPVEIWDHLSINKADENYVVDVLRRSRFIRVFDESNPLQPALVLNPVKTIFSGGSGDLTVANAGQVLGILKEKLEVVDDAALLVAASSQFIGPGALGKDDFTRFQNAFANYANARPRLDLFFIGDLPSLRLDAPNVMQAAANLGKGGTTEVSSTEFNAAYWPHLQVSDPVGIGRNPMILIPPAGHVAGIYARTDGRRGVWKAPAGIEAQLAGVAALEFDVLDIDQDTLNPRRINCLRRMPGAGLVVWGTRTRALNTEWRYVPVRRTAIFLRGSIYNGIQWAVFEPNDDRLWQALRNTIGAFMETQFRNGMFQGTTSQSAYFVKVDSETTTPDDQAAGIVNILVGFAPVRPAEFVVVTLQQMAGQTR